MLSTQHKLCRLNREALHKIKRAVLIVSIASVSVLATLCTFFQRFVVARTAGAEVCQNHVSDHDLLARPSYAQDKVEVIVNALAAEGAQLVVHPLFHECRGVIPMAAGRKSVVFGMLHHDGSVCLNKVNVGIKHIIGIFLTCIHRRFDRDRLVPVIGIDDTDKVTRCHSDTFIHGIVDAVILFAYDAIGIAFFLKFSIILVDDLQGLILGQAVNDDIFDVGIRLIQNRFQGASDRVFAIEANRD